MNINELRKLIKEEVTQALDEADKATSGAPSSYGEFRKQLAAALERAGADHALVDEVGDVDMEGGGVGDALWSAWENINLELKEYAKDERDVAWQEDIIPYYVHDCVIDMVGEFKNPMNYGPGAKKGQKPIDASALARAVVAEMSTRKKAGAGRSSAGKGSKNTIKQVTAALRKAGIREDEIEKSRSEKRIEFGGDTASDLGEAGFVGRFTDAMNSHMEQVTDDEWLSDDGNQVKLNWYDGVVTID